MAVTNSFKTYGRDTRYQTTQAMFTSGMYFTNTPIPEGAAKVLVNYDTHMNGMSLTPRRGLQTTRVAYNESAEAQDIKTSEVITSKVCYQEDKEYIQVITKTPTDEGEYNISVFTIDNTDFVADATLPHSEYAVCKTYEDGTYPKGVFTKPTSDYTIHGMHCSNKEQHIGCFVNDQYFFFDKNTKQLAYTQFDPDKHKYCIYPLKPQETPYSKAQQLGFNMLLEDPYTYTDTFLEGSSDVNTIAFHSINAFEDAECTIPAQELIENQLYYYRISYTGKGSLIIKFDWTPVNTVDWQVLKDDVAFTISESSKPKLVIPFRAAASKAILRCTASRVVTDTNVNTTTEPVDVIWFSFEYNATQTQTVKTLSNFSLHTATTMTYWQNSLVVAGVKEDKSYLFLSSAELFEYFPFPNNADYLDEPIVAVQAFMDDLLVFTHSKLYLYTFDSTTGLTRKCIQNNLNISEEETHLIKIVKNMAYFKSGNYYYMVVPKLNSVTGDLTIAPVYRFVKDLFDNFSEEVYNILQESYDITERLPLAYVHNYLDYESVHNVYMLKAKEGLYINFDLLYNTVKRVWSIYVYETSTQLHVYKQDATKPGAMLCLSFKDITSITSNNVQIVKYNPLFQLIDWATNCKDKHLPYIINTETFSITHNNKQYIDTGLIDLNSNYKKRFREIQFRVSNIGKQDLNFTTTFYIDGVVHTPGFIYTPVVDTTTGTLTLDKNLVSATPINTTIKGVAKLGFWQLSKDAFPGKDITKIRVPVSGKGFNSQIKINCLNEEDYAILDIANVYRQLYSR